MKTNQQNQIQRESAQRIAKDTYKASLVSSNIDSKGKYSIFDIASWFLSKESMTHNKLQKLCYYAQAWCYALYGYKLADTIFEAWAYGPTSPELYDKYKDSGFDLLDKNKECTAVFDSKDFRLLERVWVTYGDQTGNALETLCYNELPWRIARYGRAPGESCTTPISPEIMKSFYKSIYNGED